MNNTRDTKFILVQATIVVYYPIPVCGVWIASGADDEQYKEEQPREGLFLAGVMNC